MIDIGMPKKDRKLIADALSCMLADSCLLFTKTQGFSWNVKGEGAYSLQHLFVEQATEFFQTINALARRIRSLDFYVPASLGDFLHLTSLNEEKVHLHDPHDMVRRLIMDNEFLVRRAHDVYDLASTVNDPVTKHMMEDRMRIHSENAWKMRMQIE